jgi:hypothetical protein
VAGVILAAQDRGGVLWVRWHADTTKTVEIPGDPPVIVPDPRYVLEHEWEREPGESLNTWRARARAEARLRSQRRIALIAAATPPTDVPSLVGVDP